LHVRGRKLRDQSRNGTGRENGDVYGQTGCSIHKTSNIQFEIDAGIVR
jgi:hypothetical protein